MNDPFAKFRELLDSQYEWPAAFTFKFIAPVEQDALVRNALPAGEITTRLSATQKYISFTILTWITSTDQVIRVYEEMGRIEGVISL